MADLDALLIGLNEGINEGIANFQKIRQARVKNKQQQEIFKLEKQKAENQLKLQEAFDLDPGVIGDRKKKLSLTTKSAELQFDITDRKARKAQETVGERLRSRLGAFSELKKQASQDPELFGGLTLEFDASGQPTVVAPPPAKQKNVKDLIATIKDDKLPQSIKDSASAELAESFGVNPEDVQKDPGFFDKLFKLQEQRVELKQGRVDLLQKQTEFLKKQKGANGEVIDQAARQEDIKRGTAEATDIEFDSEAIFNDLIEKGFSEDEAMALTVKRAKQLGVTV